MEKNCNTCEFNCGVCAGRTDSYGKDIDYCLNKFGDNCEEWEISFRVFIGDYDV